MFASAVFTSTCRNVRMPFGGGVGVDLGAVVLDPVGKRVQAVDALAPFLAVALDEVLRARQILAGDVFARAPFAVADRAIGRTQLQPQGLRAVELGRGVAESSMERDAQCAGGHGSDLHGGAPSSRRGTQCRGVAQS